jgi:TolA-binding protein
MIKLFFQINFLFLALIIYCNSLYSENLRGLRVQVKDKPVLKDKLQNLKNIPESKPKKFEIEIIKKKEISQDSNLSDTVQSKRQVKSMFSKHLGDYKDKKFYFSDKIKKYYERNSKGILKPFRISEYKKYFSFIKELYNKQMYEQVISEINKLLKHRLFADERIKLNFIKLITNLQLENYDMVNQNLKTIKELDIYDKYRYELIYFTGQKYYKTDKFENAKTEFLKLYKLSPENSYTDNGLYDLAQIFIKNNKFDEAVEYLDIIINNYNNSDYADDAIFLKAKVYGELIDIKDFYKSEYNYRLLYKRYPKSEFSKVSQEKAADLRKNYL